MAVRVPEIDYYSLHGIWGAYGSLVLGRLGRGAGVVVGDVKPPRGGMFVGYRIGRGEPRLLPFSPGVTFGLGASAYREDEVRLRAARTTCAAPPTSGPPRSSATSRSRARSGAQVPSPSRSSPSSARFPTRRRSLPLRRVPAYGLPSCSRSASTTRTARAR